MGIQLRYIGDGAWLSGVPASDHEVKTEAEADRLVYRYAGDERLLDEKGQPLPTGIYERADGAKKATKPLPQGEVLPEPDEGN